MQRHRMLLSVIIISYNTRQITIETLESLLAEIARSSSLKNNTEIFVVDNNSSDDSVEAIAALAKKHSSIQLIRNSHNAGFANANNQAITKSTGKYIFLL